MSNPLLDTSSLPRFNELAPEQVVPALSELIAEHRQKLEALLDANQAEAKAERAALEAASKKAKAGGKKGFYKR